MRPTAPARHFTRDDPSKWLDEKTLAQAEGYVGAVSQLHISDVKASVLVQGAALYAYLLRRRNLFTLSTGLFSML